jgi:hypothetical protein
VDHDPLEALSTEDPRLDDLVMPTFVLDGGNAEAVGLLADRFGADPALDVVRLRLGREVRYLRRQALYGLLATESKGFGQGGRAALPGRPGPGQAAEYTFRCPVPGCPDSPVTMLAFSDPPDCLRHRVRLDLVPTGSGGR